MTLTGTSARKSRAGSADERTSSCTTLLFGETPDYLCSNFSCCYFNTDIGRCCTGSGCAAEFPSEFHTWTEVDEWGGLGKKQKRKKLRTQVQLVNGDWKVCCGLVRVRARRTRRSKAAERWRHSNVHILFTCKVIDRAAASPFVQVCSA